MEITRLVCRLDFVAAWPLPGSRSTTEVHALGTLAGGGGISPAGDPFDAACSRQPVQDRARPGSIDTDRRQVGRFGQAAAVNERLDTAGDRRRIIEFGRVGIWWVYTGLTQLAGHNACWPLRWTETRYPGATPVQRRAPLAGSDRQGDSLRRVVGVGVAGRRRRHVPVFGSAPAQRALKPGRGRQFGEHVAEPGHWTRLTPGPLVVMSQ